ncbi:MAG: hypothetical protein AB4042_11940 [Leptolyngbyaceae cyanobacterium]
MKTRQGRSPSLRVLRCGMGAAIATLCLWSAGLDAALAQANILQNSQFPPNPLDLPEEVDEDTPHDP